MDFSNPSHGAFISNLDRFIREQSEQLNIAENEVRVLGLEMLGHDLAVHIGVPQASGHLTRIQVDVLMTVLTERALEAVHEGQDQTED